MEYLGCRATGCASFSNPAKVILAITMIEPKYWFITYHVRKVTAEGPQERFCNEAISIHPMDWIYQLNRDNVEYHTLIYAMPIDEDRYNLAQKDHMKKGTTSIKRPKNIKPTW